MRWLCLYPSAQQTNARVIIITVALLSLRIRTPVGISLTSDVYGVQVGYTVFFSGNEGTKAP